MPRHLLVVRLALPLDGGASGGVLGLGVVLRVSGVTLEFAFGVGFPGFGHPILVNLTGNRLVEAISPHGELHVVVGVERLIVVVVVVCECGGRVDGQEKQGQPDTMSISQHPRVVEHAVAVPDRGEAWITPCASHTHTHTHSNSRTQT